MSYGFRIVRVTSVAPQQLYNCLADAETWSEWAPMVGRSELARPGTPDPLGAGAIRRIRGLAIIRVDEQIVEAYPPSYQRYTLRGLPLIDYCGEVRLSRADSSTRLEWTGRFRPQIPATGYMLAKFLEWSIARIADALIIRCQTVTTNKS